MSFLENPTNSNLRDYYFPHEYMYKFKEISLGILERPNLSELCELLARQVCPSGEITRVLLAKLYPDNYIRTVSYFGHSESLQTKDIERNIQDDTPLTRAFNQQDILYFDKNEFAFLFPGQEIVDKESHWETNILIRISDEFVFYFSCQTQFDDRRIAKLYFQVIGELLKAYLHKFGRQFDLKLDSHIKSDSLKNLVGTKLTARQEQILAAIRLGKTNKEIAADIDYSESLVRHETIIIYAKLGLRGRKEILGVGYAKKKE